MSFESDLGDLLEPLARVGNRVWWNALPDGTPIPDRDAFILLDSLGGEPRWYVDRGPGESMPSHKHARVMVTIQTRDQVLRNSLKRLVEKTLYQSDFIVRAYGAPMDIWEPALKLFGSQQQFGFWYPDP